MSVAFKVQTVEIAQWHRLQRPHSVKIRASRPNSRGPNLGTQQNHNKISVSKCYDPIALLRFVNCCSAVPQRDFQNGDSLNLFLPKMSELFRQISPEVTSYAKIY